MIQFRTVGPSGSWDDINAAGPSVIYDGTKYHMWYVGRSASGNAIGYATSQDSSITAIADDLSDRVPTNFALQPAR